MTVSANIVVTMVSGTARFYTDAAGTLGESTTWNLNSGAMRTIYVRCPSGSSNMTFSDGSKIIKWGSGSGVNGWASAANAAKVTARLTYLNLQEVVFSGTALINGALPSGLKNLLLNGSSIEWTYEGALPSGLNQFLYLNGSSIAWTYEGALPTGVYAITMNGSLINWTGLDIGNNGNITTFSLSNYRIAKMSSADMVTLLTQMKNRTGSLPATVTINDYADYASPPSEVTDAVDALKAAKSITTVSLGA